MEPPATPRRPKRPAKETPETSPEGGEAPAKPRSSKASTPSSRTAGKPAPKPRTTKKPEPAAPPAEEAAPAAKASEPPAAEAASMPVINPANELPAATAEPEEPGSSPSTLRIPGLAAPRTRTARTSSTGPAKQSPGDRLVVISRTLVLRNMEIARKYGTRAGHTVRESVTRLSERLPKRETVAQSTATTTGRLGSSIKAQLSNAGRRTGEAFDRGFNFTERRLQESDTAVIAFTLILILACIVLTTLAVYVWNHY